MAAKSGKLRMPIILAMGYMEGFDTRVPGNTQSRAESNIAAEKNGCITLRCASVSAAACGAYFLRLLRDVVLNHAGELRDHGGRKVFEVHEEIW